jgi:serine/threonine-protein kinase RsbW
MSCPFSHSFLSENKFAIDLFLHKNNSVLDINLDKKQTYSKVLSKKKHEIYRRTVREKETTYSIPSKIEAIDEAVQKATAFAGEAGFADDALFGIDMAVREALANAVKHGNKLDESKTVEITLVSSDKAMEILIRDFGEGFDVREVPDPTNPENLLKASGRGILFMHNFVDKVEWARHGQGGMVVKMTKNH